VRGAASRRFGRTGDPQPLSLIGGLATLLLIAVIGLSGAARAQAGDYAPVTLHVACGELFDPACGKVLPRIAAQIARGGLVLKPVESGRARDTVASVCQDQAAAAIVQRDAIVELAHDPACKGRYDVIRRSLYPYYGFLVVRADTPFRSLDDLASDGRTARIAAGPEGSGGQITLGFLLRSNAVWQRAIAVTDDSAVASLGRIADGSIDGVFFTETLDSELITRIRLRADARGKPLYRFIDVRPEAEFSRIGDGEGHCLYRITGLDFGGPAPVTTVSVDAVMMLGRAFRDAHARGGPRAADALASAIDANQAAVLAETKSPGDWRPAATSCQ
jgi:hypothetical protein